VDARALADSTSPARDADLFDANFASYLHPQQPCFYARIGVVKVDEGTVPASMDDTLVNGSFSASTPIRGLLVSSDFDEDGWDPNATRRNTVGKDWAKRPSTTPRPISVLDPDEDDLDHRT
jgi:hypothetical protein